MLIVLAEVPYEKFILSSTCPRTSTWSPINPNKQPSYDLNWSGENYKLLNVSQNITSAKLPWSMGTRCTLLPTVTTDITTGSSSCGTTSSKSELVKQRVSFVRLPGFLTFIAITSLTYFLRLEAVHLSPKNPPEMVFRSLWTGTSCTWSPGATFCFVSWFSSRYSFKNLSFTKPANWLPRAIHLSTSCPNPLWNSHQISFCNPNSFQTSGGISVFPRPQVYFATPCRSFRTCVKMPNLLVLLPCARSS